jgi:signal peptidase I
MKRLALVAVLGLSLAACGGGSKSVVLRSQDSPDEYLKITGPADAARSAAGMLKTMDSSGSDFVAVRAVHGRKTCAQAFPIVSYPLTGHGVEGARQKITLALYNSDGYRNASDCDELPKSFPHGFPLFGGNLRIYRWPTAQFPPSGMEPTLHCPDYGCKPDVPPHNYLCRTNCCGYGCYGPGPDVVVYQLTGTSGLKRGAIVVFRPQRRVALQCAEGDVLVSRVIGVPGETVREDGRGRISIRAPGAASWTQLDEPYVGAAIRGEDTGHLNQQWRVPVGQYFVVGDNRGASCDSRQWGSVPATRVIGRVVHVVRGGTVMEPPGIG